MSPATDRHALIDIDVGGRVVYEPHQLTARAEMRLPSLANMRKHWRAMLGIRKAQRATGVLLARKAFGPFSAPGFGAHGTFLIAVTLTRVGARKLDSDNLASAFKHVRDGVAEYVGVDDGDERWTWNYAQRSGSKVYAVEAAFVIGGTT